MVSGNKVSVKESLSDTMSGEKLSMNEILSIP